jgi:hypothetical protein
MYTQILSMQSTGDVRRKECQRGKEIKGERMTIVWFDT